MTAPESFVFVLVNAFSHLAFSCAVEPLRIANLIAGKELYRWRFASENSQTATCSNGAVMLVHQGLIPAGQNDQVFILSGIGVQQQVTPALLNYIRRERARGTRLGALCSGAYILAKAGLLNGQRAAIHWEFHDSFMEEFPDVALCRSVFVAGERHITASGGTATADLMLHLIEERHGLELSIAVGDQMVYNAVRDGGAEQKVSFQARHGMRNEHLQRAIEMMNDSIEEPLSPAAIAEELGISTRQLERLFSRHLNCSPKKYFVDLRLSKARRLLVQTERSITDISLACGFSSPSHFARSFRTHYGILPSKQRARLS